MKIIKVVWTTPIWFNEQKYGWGAVLKGIPDAMAVDLERKHMVVILGEDEGDDAPPAKEELQITRPAKLEAPAKPAKPAKADKGPAPSIDDLLGK